MNAAMFSSGARRTRLLWGSAFVLAMGLAGGVINSTHLSFLEVLAVAIAPTLLLIPFVRSAERVQVEAGCITAATQRYTRRFVAMSFAYVIVLFTALGLSHETGVTGPLLWLLALLPCVPIMGMIWAMARLLVEETDEYQRLRMVRASLVATGVLLVLGTVWGFLEMFGLAPHLWLWLVFPVWAMGLGFGQLVNRLVFGDEGC